MNTSATWKSALARVGRHLGRPFSVRLRGGVFLSVLAFAGFPAIALAQSCPGLHVKILDIRNSTGTVACALFESSEGFPDKFLKSATDIVMTAIRDTKARCNFLDVPPGTYSLAVIHDENMDGELATNWLGIPTEGYGFSSGAVATMSAPSFEEASFSYDGQNLDMTIKLNY
ncbi:MAG: DUF2141 domain-containing protein [Pseudomonadota bacterium]